MSIKGISIGLLLSLTAAMPALANQSERAAVRPRINAPAPQWSWEGSDSALSQHDLMNSDLTAGSYEFANFNTPGGFFDEWHFTLAGDANVSFSLFDLEQPLTGVPLAPLGRNGSVSSPISSSYLLDNKYLTVSLFDKSGLLLGTVGQNGLLSALGLHGGDDYTLAVSGRAAGLLGGVYHGNLNVAPVPLGNTLPLFASALLVVGLRSRKIGSKLPV